MSIKAIKDFIVNAGKLKKMFGTTPILIGDIPIDVLLSEVSPDSWIITTHPMEAGLLATDSRIAQPKVLQMGCVILNPDLSVSGITAFALDSDKNPFEQASWDEKRDAFLALTVSNNLLTVVTPNKTYPNMMITGVAPLYSSIYKDSFVFNISFKQQTIISSDISAIDDSQIPIQVKKKRKTPKKATKKKANKPLSKDAIQGTSEWSDADNWENWDAVTEDWSW